MWRAFDASLIRDRHSESYRRLGAVGSRDFPYGLGGERRPGRDGNPSDKRYNSGGSYGIDNRA